MSMRRGNAPSSAETAERGLGGSPAPVGRGARRPPGAAAVRPAARNQGKSGAAPVKRPNEAALGDTPAAAIRAPKARKPAAVAAADRPARPGASPQATFARLRALHPDAHCELDHSSSFELLVATVLSAQTTDVLVNKVTPHLFGAYPDARALAGADPAEVAALLRRLGMGMFNQKARNVVGLARGLVERHGGEVPRTLAELVKLPGVGRKTANVVLGVAFGAPEGVVVDTHVQRLSQRLGWTKSDKPEQIERDLVALFPQRDWDMLSHTLIFHGRRICFARKPACGGCGINDACPSAFRAENVGRKAPRSPRRGGAQA